MVPAISLYFGPALTRVAGDVMGPIWNNPVAGTCLILMLLELIALFWLASWE